MTEEVDQDWGPPDAIALYPPGRKVPASGVWAIEDRERVERREATLIKGQRFPPARPGQLWHSVYIANAKRRPR